MDLRKFPNIICFQLSRVFIEENLKHLNEKYEKDNLNSKIIVDGFTDSWEMDIFIVLIKFM